MIESNYLPNLVVIGRTNYTKSSSSINRLLDALRSDGAQIYWFRSAEELCFQVLHDKFINLGNSKISAFCKERGRFGRALRRLTKLLLLLGMPRFWHSFAKKYFGNGSSNEHKAQEVLLFIKSLKKSRVSLLGHSAGGIVASLIASEECVDKIACFGYPFKFPNRDEEPNRTKHLGSVNKPMLIFQGDQDEYGNKDDRRKYGLSSHVEVVSVQATHDYEHLDEDTYQACLGRLSFFFKQVE
jgi:uncharacterized protein